MGVGFSDYGDLPGADLCVLWRDWRGTVYFSDVHVSKVNKIFVYPGLLMRFEKGWIRICKKIYINIPDPPKIVPFHSIYMNQSNNISILGDPDCYFGGPDLDHDFS